MDDLAKAAFVIAQAACCQAEVAGMVAENQRATHRGQGPTYGFDAFEAVPIRYGLGHNDVIGYLTGRG